MAFWLAPAITRRRFVYSTLPLGGLLARAEAPLTRWALLSDTHVPGNPANEYRGFRPYENTLKAVSQVVEFEPDGAIICGDLARLEGEIDDYENLKRLLEPLSGVPAGLVLGNHDNRRNFLRVFPKPVGAQDVKDKHVVVIETPAARFVLLDSLFMVNQVPGLLGKAQRTWLDNYLRGASGLPTILFVHHTLDDGDGSLLDWPRVLDIIRGQRLVKAVIYGHSHVYGFRTESDIHLINLPAVGYNFGDAHPVGWVEARFATSGAEFTLRAFGGNRTRDRETHKLQWRV